MKHIYLVSILALVALLSAQPLVSCNNSADNGFYRGSDDDDAGGDDDDSQAGDDDSQAGDDDSQAGDDDSQAGDDDTSGGGGGGSGGTGWSNEEEQVGGCSDGTDNDGDGLVDCLDEADCCASNDCINASNCNSGDDDDAGGPGDDDDTGDSGEDLFGGADCDENGCPNCEDCNDNDADGLYDCDDPDCTMTDYCKHIGSWSLSTHCP